MMRLGPFRTTITFEKPTLMDRIYFTWMHRKGLPLNMAWSLLRGKATGISYFDYDGYTGTVFLNRGEWRNRARHRERRTYDPRRT